MNCSTFSPGPPTGPGKHRGRHTLTGKADSPVALQRRRHTRYIQVRLTAEEHASVDKMADTVGITLSELVRRRMRGAKIIRRRDTTRAAERGSDARAGLLRILTCTRGEPTRDVALSVDATADRIEAFIRALDDPDRDDEGA